MLHFKEGSTVTYQTSDAVGFDLETTVDFILQPNEYRAIPTGLFLDVEANTGLLELIKQQSEFAIPELQIRPRSGLAAKKGVTVLNSPGTIDPLYPDEIKVILINLGSIPAHFAKGDRIAQGVIAVSSRSPSFPVLSVTRTGGFGSTGGV